MSEKAGGLAVAHAARVEAINGPVPDDHPSHALRLAAAKDLVARCERQLDKAKAELARLQKEKP